jgi:hypothetical protein
MVLLLSMRSGIYQDMTHGLGKRPFILVLSIYIADLRLSSGLHSHSCAIWAVLASLNIERF